MVKIKWFGHACVSLTRGDGYVVVIDPHDGYSIGLKKPEVKGDLILVTHDHFDHNAVDVVKKSGSRVLKTFFGEIEVDRIKVCGFKSFHDKEGGRKRGVNSIYLIEINGVRIAHLGDLGQIPEENVIESLKSVDLLITPVGGTFTIEPDEAWSIVDKTKPRNVLPIHYWVSGLRLPLRTIDDFLTYVKGYNVVKLDGSEFDIAKHFNSIIVAKPVY